MAAQTPDTIDAMKTLINSYDRNATALRVLDASGSNSNDIINVDEVSSVLTYVGFAAPGVATTAPSWKIIRLAISGTVTSVLYADGNDSYDNIWTARAGLSYS